MNKAWFLLLFLTNCFTSEKEASQVLKRAGFQYVNFLGISWWGCPEGDKYGLKFGGINNIGLYSEGVVCCDRWFKGCLVRY